MAIEKSDPNMKTRFDIPGNWITLMDYAAKNGVSLSTLRRHIKAQKLTFKVEEGRYLLWDSTGGSLWSDADVQMMQTRLARVTQDLKQAQEEIAELKTLIALYEETIPPYRLNN